MEIVVRDLCCAFLDAEVLRKASCSIPSGSIVLLVGSNGCGKSTFLRILVGLIPRFQPATVSGVVQVGGQSLLESRASTTLEGISFVLDEVDDQFIGLTPREELARATVRAGKIGSDSSIEALAASWGIAGLLDQETETLSMGQKRLVLLCGALSVSHTLLVLDEPTAGLDAESISLLLRFLSGLRGGRSTVLIATQSPHLFSRFADLALVMDGGVMRSAAVADV
jgi:ABC-type multidrug transport system ATPase subunit